jgi:hypothetical protein
MEILTIFAISYVALPVAGGSEAGMTIVRVECYAGYRGDQRPVRFMLGEQGYQVREIEDQWYSPGAIYFRVLADDGNLYFLRHNEEEDDWTLEGFRAPR